MTDSVSDRRIRSLGNGRVESDANFVSVRPHDSAVKFLLLLIKYEIQLFTHFDGKFDFHTRSRERQVNDGAEARKTAVSHFDSHVSIRLHSKFGTTFVHEVFRQKSLFVDEVSDVVDGP
jgi:hypothetical protein